MAPAINTSADALGMIQSIMTAMSVWTFGSLAILLIGGIVMGVLTHKLAGKKGYTGYFWTGFFLGIIGLIYVVGLPVRQDMKEY